MSKDSRRDACDAGRGAVLLLSGGMDSTAMAAWLRPSATLFIDYGQRPADAERRASKMVAAALGLPYAELGIDLSAVGSGLLCAVSPGDGLDQQASAVLTVSPSPEWWPLRNQLLCTIAAAWALSASTEEVPLTSVLAASVLGDGTRHVDGTRAFYESLDAVTAMQEGGIRILAPAIEMSAVDLLQVSEVDESVVAWTHSCHRSDLPCADCPGCWKREQVLHDTGMLGHGPSRSSDDVSEVDEAAPVGERAPDRASAL